MPLRAGNTSNVVVVAYGNIAIIMEIDGVNYIVFGFHGKYFKSVDTIRILMMLELLLLRLLLLRLLLKLLLLLLMLKFFYLLLTEMIMTSSHWRCNAISH